MRRLLVVLVVTATTAILPMTALAGNQEAAEQIAASLRDSGQLHAYKIGVKYQDGTAWVRGRVASREQMNTALRLVFKAQGVKRVVNNLSVEPGQQSATAGKETPAAKPRFSIPSLLAAPLRQVAGAMAPEQRHQPVSMAVDTSRSQQTVKEHGIASAVPATFNPGLVQPAAATSHEMVPTLASPQMVAQAAPRPTPASMAAQQPQMMVPVGQPIPIAYVQGGQGSMPQHVMPVGAQAAPAQYDQPHMPNHAWPSYAAYPNYAGVTYPKQYSPTAWPYIGPFYPYPQVPLGWRKVTLEWHDGWWNLDFDDGSTSGPFSGLFRSHRKR